MNNNVTNSDLYQVFYPLQTYGLLTEREVKMAEYWPSSFLCVCGLRRSSGP